MGKFNFGKNNNQAVKKVQLSSEAPVITKEVYIDRIVEVPVEVIKEITIEKQVEVIKEVIVEKIIELPVVVTKIELVEVEKRVEVPVEKIVTIIDKSLLFQEKQNSRRLEGKIKRLYIALACMIVISMLMAVI